MLQAEVVIQKLEQRFLRRIMGMRINKSTASGKAHIKVITHGDFAPDILDQAKAFLYMHVEDDEVGIAGRLIRMQSSQQQNPQIFEYEFMSCAPDWLDETLKFEADGQHSNAQRIRVFLGNDSTNFENYFFRLNPT